MFVDNEKFVETFFNKKKDDTIYICYFYNKRESTLLSEATFHIYVHRSSFDETIQYDEYKSLLSNFSVDTFGMKCWLSYMSIDYSIPNMILILSSKGYKPTRKLCKELHPKQFRLKEGR